MKFVFTLFFIFLVFWGRAQSFWDISLSYRIPVNKNSIHSSGHGIAWDFYFFPLKNDSSRKLNVAILGGWGWQDKLWNNKMNSAFTGDFSNHLIRENFSGIDSLGVARFANEGKDICGWTAPVASYHEGIHERSFYAGLQLFFEGEIRTSMKFYFGMREAIAGINYDTLCNSPGSANSLTSEYGYFHIKRPVMLGGSISLQPFAKIFKNTKLDWKQFFVSFYYEYSDFTRAKFKYWSGCEGTEFIPFDKILPENILDKHKKDVRFGLRLGFFFIQE